MIQPSRTASLVTRDGVRLDADIYLPPGPGRHPVLLMRQPYGRRIASTVTFAHPAWYASHGYVVVVQDVRGRGTSQGTFDPLAHEREDALDTLDWVADLPMGNGHIGMYGFSYQGATQLLAAATGHPALKAIVPAMAPFDLRDDFAYEGGAFRSAASIGWAAQVGAETCRIAGNADGYVRLREIAHQTPERLLCDPAGPEARALLQGTHYARWLDEPAGAEYWAARSPRAALGTARVPMLVVGGWFDIFLSGTLDLHARNQAAGVERHLVVGPWTHLPWTRHAGAMTFGHDAHSSVDDWQRAWFDRHLKGHDDAGHGGQAVRLFDLGRGAWHVAGNLPAHQPLRLHFASDGRAALREDGGRLLPDPGPRAVDHLVHDPWRPAPSVGVHLAVPGGLQDRSAVDARPDVAVYSTPPLEHPLALAGPAAVTLAADADHASFDLSVTLSMVDPGGRALTLAAAHRRVIGAGPHRLDLRLLCAHVQSGWRLRISVAGACHPALAGNPGDGRPAGAVRAADLPVITIAIDSAASHLDLAVSD